MADSHLQGIFHMEEHNFFGLVIAAATPDAQEAGNQISYIIDWNLSTDAT